MNRPQGKAFKVGLMVLVLAAALLGMEGLLGKTPAALAGPNPITTCPISPITTNTTLAADIVATRTPCIEFGADNIALFMAGHTIDMRGQGNTAVAIQSMNRTNVRVEGPGTVLTTKTCVVPCTPSLPDVGSINVSGGTNVRIRDINVRNVSAAGLPLVGGGAGTGILLNGTPGALLLDNLVDSYARGVWVLNSSNVSGGGASLIGHNIITNNASPEDPSFGLGLDGTSDWVIVHNIAMRNGNFVGVDTGIILTTHFGASGSSNNQVVGNRADMNFGDGIHVSDGSIGNMIVTNHATLNTQFDLFDGNPPGSNTWNRNNVCKTEAGSVPPDVCNPGEM